MKMNPICWQREFSEKLLNYDNNHQNTIPTSQQLKQLPTVELFESATDRFYRRQNEFIQAYYKNRNNPTPENRTNVIKTSLKYFDELAERIFDMQDKTAPTSQNAMKHYYCTAKDILRGDKKFIPEKTYQAYNNTLKILNKIIKQTAPKEPSKLLKLLRLFT